MKKPKIWFSLYDFSFNYKGEEPNFWQPEDFRWATPFQSQLTKILSELETYLASKDLSPYFNETMTNKKEIWNTVSLKTWDIELFKNQKDFPITTKIMKEFPEIVSLSFNRLEGGGQIIPHCGDTNAIVRCHLGLIVPQDKEKCFFKVRDESKYWQKGEWLVFTDAYIHEAVNQSNEARFILLMDVLRDEFADRRSLVTSTVLTSLFLQKRAQKLKILYKSPAWVIKFISFCLRPLAWLASLIVNWLKVY
jgi:aspartyl/asparaginyl beta-hydroxylase (cupin superfamily)